MKLEDQTDEGLMAEMQNGNTLALNVLHSRYRASLLNYVTSRVTRDLDYCEDILQMIFLRIHKHADKFTPGLLFRPWVYAMADRLCKNANRDLHRRARRERPDADFEHLACEDTTEKDQAQFASDRSVEIAKDRRHEEIKLAMLEELPQLVLDLPAELRQVVQFVLTNGASLRKAETILGVGRRTLSKRMVEACKIIRARLDGLPVESGATLSMVAESTIMQLLDDSSEEDCEALGRVMLLDGEDAADLAVLSSMLGKVLANNNVANVASELAQV